MAKAIMIDAARRDVYEVTIPEPVKGDDGGLQYQAVLDEYYRLLGCTMVECAGRCANGDALLVDEEGLLKPMTPDSPFFSIKSDAPNSGPTILAGSGLIVGRDLPRDGGIADATSTLEDIRSRVVFLTASQAREAIDGTTPKTTTATPKGEKTMEGMGAQRFTYKIIIGSESGDGQLHTVTRANGETSTVRETGHAYTNDERSARHIATALSLVSAIKAKELVIFRTADSKAVAEAMIALTEAVAEQKGDHGEMLMIPKGVMMTAIASVARMLVFNQGSLSSEALFDEKGMLRARGILESTPEDMADGETRSVEITTKLYN